MLDYKRKLSTLYSDYLISQISTNDKMKVKKSLQEISKKYREGYFISPDKLRMVELLLVGLLNTSEDNKIQRWVLNVLARIGSKNTCVEPIAQFLEKNPNLDSQIIASGVSALYGLQKNPKKYLERINISPTLIELSALQHVPIKVVNPVHLPISIENANVDELKLALILAGLGKSGNKVFGNYKDNEVIKILGGHDDPIVSQYTIWAIAENKDFNFSDIGIKHADIISCPDNVREWFYRLLATRSYAAMANQDMLEEGAQDDEDLVRSGLARGLKETFFEGLEDIVLGWFIREPSLEVRSSLMVHIVENSQNSDGYHKFLIDFFEAGKNNDLWEVAKASAGGLPIYGHLIRTSQAPDLFPEDAKTVYNFNGNVNAPGSAFGNNNTVNSNDSNITFNPEEVQKAKNITEQAINVMECIPEEIKSRNRDLFADASEKLLISQSEPSPVTMKNSLNCLKGIAQLASESDEILKQLNPLIQDIGNLFQ